MFRHFHFLTLLWLSTAVLGFSPSSVSIGRRDSTKLQAHSSQGTPTRRNILEVFGVVAASSFVSPPASAASGLDLESYLYKVVRVREATQQERRLIQTGKFKDKARQNVKLAVKFMIQNYQLSDSINGASAYLTGNSAQMRAIDVGQSAVQSLQTILEYFDTSDVENIKVRGKSGGTTEFVGVPCRLTFEV